LQNIVFVFVPIHIEILNNQQTIEQLFNVMETLIQDQVTVFQWLLYIKYGGEPSSAG
jgi:PII-like signaling protein